MTSPDDQENAMVLPYADDGIRMLSEREQEMSLTIDDLREEVAILRAERDAQTDIADRQADAIDAKNLTIDALRAEVKFLDERQDAWRKQYEVMRDAVHRHCDTLERRLINNEDEP